MPAAPVQSPVAPVSGSLTGSREGERRTGAQGEPGTRGQPASPGADVVVHETLPLPPIEVLHFAEFMPIVDAGGSCYFVARCETCFLVARVETTRLAALGELDEACALREYRWPRVLHIHELPARVGRGWVR